MKRKYYFLNLFVCFCVAMILGCARMAVNVDILNSAYWADPGYSNSALFAQIIFIEEKISTGQFDMECEKLKEDVNKSKMDDDQKKDLCSKINIAFSNAKIEYQKAFNEVSTYGKLTQKAKEFYANGSAELLAILRNVSTLEKVAKENLTSMKKLQQASLTKPEILGAKKKEEEAQRNLNAIEEAQRNLNAIKDVENTTGETVSGLIQNATIREDPRASAAVNAPKQYWEGKFNQTLCNGWFGNTDCAVKMEDLGDFTIKGVRLDAAKITNATFTVATEAIQIAAAIYGIPVPKAQATGDGQAAVEDVSPAKRQRDAEAAILQLRLARLAMFETIVAQRQAIKDKKSRDQAFITIKKALEENSKLLDPSTAQPQTGN